MAQSRNLTRTIAATAVPLASALLVSLGCGGNVKDVAPGDTPNGAGGTPEQTGLDGGSGGRGDGGPRDGGPGDGGSGAGGGGSGGTRCQGGYTECGDECVNTNTSDDHCGRCGNPCALDSACYGRTCEKIINARPCGPTETICRDLGCVDLDTNPYACGDCSTICPDNTACVSGKCDPNQCGFGFVLCESTDGSSSAPAECVSLDSSDAHCGRCGNACDATNEHCSEGKCVSSCGALETGCPGSGCVDLASRVDHCGECGKSCHPSTSDQYGWMQCMSGECACPAGTSRCGEDCAEHTFYCAPDTGSDPVELCKARAGSPFERCACDSCFDLLAECTKDPRCVHAVDCGFDNGCPSCPQPYVYECRERNDLLHPVAFKIVECMNSRCGGG